MVAFSSMQTWGNCYGIPTGSSKFALWKKANIVVPVNHTATVPESCKEIFFKLGLQLSVLTSLLLKYNIRR